MKLGSSGRAVYTVSIASVDAFLSEADIAEAEALLKAVEPLTAVVMMSRRTRTSPESLNAMTRILMTARGRFASPRIAMVAGNLTSPAGATSRVSAKLGRPSEVM